MFPAGSSRSNQPASAHSSTAGGPASKRTTITLLGPTVQRLLQAGLAPSTQRVYASGKKKYLTFCQLTGSPPLPVTEHNLMYFVAFAVNKGLKHQTIKSYLSAVRHLQVSCGGGDPQLGSMPQLGLALRGARKEQAGQLKRTRLPITPAVPLKMHQVWNQKAASWDHIMLWAACCLGFFGFLRSGELTVPEVWEFDPGLQLSFSDISVDNSSNPRSLAVQIKQSKTDQLRQGVAVFVGRMDTILCPVAAVLAYLALRGSGEGPLF